MEKWIGQIGPEKVYRYRMNTSVSRTTGMAGDGRTEGQGGDEIEDESIVFVGRDLGTGARDGGCGASGFGNGGLGVVGCIVLGAIRRRRP